MYVPVKILSDAHALGHSGADALGYYRSQHEAWGTLNESVPWDWLNVTLDNRDAKKMAGEYAVTVKTWIIDNGRPALVGFIQKNMLDGTVNQTVVEDTLDQLLKMVSAIPVTSNFSNGSVPSTDKLSSWMSLVQAIDTSNFSMNFSENFRPLTTVTHKISLLYNALFSYTSVFMSFNVALLVRTAQSVKYIMDFILQTVVFFTILIYLLLSNGQEQKVFDVITRLINTDTSQRLRLEMTITTTVSKVMRFTFKMPIFHMVFTWFTYSLFGVGGGFFWAVLSALAALLAVVPVSLIVVIVIIIIIISCCSRLLVVITCLPAWRPVR